MNFIFPEASVCIRGGEDLEGSALEHLPRGRVPLDSRLLGYGASLYRPVTPCLAGTSRKDAPPPTHFFVKKKFGPIGGAETATQKVPSVFCYARDFLCEVKRCATHGILQSGLPPDGGIPAMPRTFRRNVWERGPPLLRRSGGGGRIPPGVQRTPICTYRSEARPQSAQKPLCGAGSTPHAGGSFFLYEKSVLRESDCLCDRKRKVCTDLTPPLPPLKKPLK